MMISNKKQLITEGLAKKKNIYLEKTEKLEQLRFLQHGFRIDVAIIESAPVSVDTYADLERVRSLAMNNC